MTTKPDTDQRPVSQEAAIEWMKARHPLSLFETLGMRVESYDPEKIVIAVDVDQRLHQPAGVVHGGVYVVLAETAASIAATLSIDLTTHFAVGQEINANHLRPVVGGTIRAISKCLHKGRTSHVYHIDVMDEKERLVCVSRCTMAIRPQPTSE